MQTTTNYKLNKPDLTDKVRVQDLNANMDTLDKTVKEIADESDASSDAVKAMQTTVSGYTSDINTLKSDSAQAKTDIQKLKTDVSSAQDNIGTLQTDVSGAKENIQSLQTDVSGTKDDITALQAKYGEIEANIDDIESKAESVTQRVGQLEGEYTTLNGTVKTAQEKLNKITNPMIIKGTKQTVAELEQVSGAEPGWIYFVGETDAKDYDEYVYTESNKWEKLGHMDIDMSKYATVEAVTSQLAGKVDKTDFVFATETEVTAMLNEVFDTSATAILDEEASDMEVLSYEE